MNYRSILLATVQTIGLFMIGLFIPLVAWMITPVPLILCYVRNNQLHGLIAFGLSSVVILMLPGIPVAIFFILFIFGLIAMGNSDGLLRQRKPEVSILMGVLPSVAIVGMTAAYYYVKTGENPLVNIETFIQLQRDATVKLYNGLGFNEVAATISSIPDTSIHFFCTAAPLHP